MTAPIVALCLTDPPDGAPYLRAREILLLRLFGALVRRFDMLKDYHKKTK